MSAAASIFTMQQAINRYIQANIPKDKDNNKAQLGTISNNFVIVGNKKYRSDKVNDMYLKNGDSVVCLIPDSGNFAAIVGKA